MLKDMIKAEVARAVKEGASEDKKQLKFSQTMAKICLKYFEESIHGRGVFILLELFETESTQKFVSKELKAQKKEIKDLVKKDPSAKGLVVLLKVIEKSDK